MKGSRCKDNLIITIIKTRSQEIHKLLSSTPQETWKTSFLSARAMRIIIPIVTVWHHFFLLTNGKSRAVQTRGQKLYRSAKPLFSLIVQTSPHLILDLSQDGQWKGKKSFPKKKVFLFLYPLERRCKRGQTKKFFLPMPPKLELMFNILFTPLLNYTLQKCQSTLKWIFPPRIFF